MTRDMKTGRKREEIGPPEQSYFLFCFMTVKKEKVHWHTIWL